jgi:myo-inositol-1(or 4)-monophosphatase
MTELRNVLLEATKAAGAIIQEYFNGTFVIENKEGINNLVTEVDKLAEDRIIEVIQRSYPGHSIISEEVGDLPQDSEYQWIIDPIDGTVNFAHGIPLCCVSIALKHKDDLLLGAVYNPMMNELFFAEKGQGAFLNGEKIRVSTQADLAKSCLVTGFPYTYIDAHNGPLQCFERFIRQGIPVRRLGSAAIDLCWVACGRFDGFYEHKLHAWDSAAGFLMVLEAGGTVTDYTGAPYSPYQPHILATNGHLHADMLAVINNEKTL